MFRIGVLSQKTGVPRKTIRYYEAIGLLPQPRRTENGYRVYDKADVERLLFVRRARRLDFSLSAIAEILAFRERGEPPCHYVLDLMQTQITLIEERIRELQQLRDELTELHTLGRKLPEDAQMQTCVCQLIQTGIPRESVKSHVQPR